MGKATAGLRTTAPGAGAEPRDGSDDHTVLLPGRSPVLDVAQLGILRGYGSERDVAVGDVLFSDGDETYDLIVLLVGTADIVRIGRSGFLPFMIIFGPWKESYPQTSRASTYV
jgi:hypothetical protein